MRNYHAIGKIWQTQTKPTAYKTYTFSQSDHAYETPYEYCASFVGTSTVDLKIQFVHHPSCKPQGTVRTPTRTVANVLQVPQEVLSLSANSRLRTRRRHDDSNRRLPSSPREIHSYNVFFPKRHAHRRTHAGKRDSSPSTTYRARAAADDAVIQQSSAVV